MAKNKSKTSIKAASPRVDFVKLEQKIMTLWENNDIPKRYRERNIRSEKKFGFMDGPITANNPMGVHHAWGRFYKDLFLRFRNMQGYAQRFQNGFDGQGLWVEVEVEKEKGFKSKQDIETYGIGPFVEDCKSRVLSFSERITAQSKRLGYFMDWENSYQTMSDENNYTIWLFLKRCYEQGWIYEGEDVMPWCPRCGTGLSQQEIITEGYQETVHPGFFVKFPLLDREGESLLVWTTTPWTLVANVATAVNPDQQYVQVENKFNLNGEAQSELLWLGSKCLDVLKGSYEIKKTIKGSNLVGWEYNGPFDELPAQKEINHKHRVLPWNEVSEEEGTGIVHIAPGAGAEDFKLGKENKLPVIAPLNDNGEYINGFGFLSGQYVGNVNKQIFDNLKNKGYYYKTEQYRHRYPFCWRCGTELVFRLVNEWFISMDELRPKLITATKKMNWVPKFGEAREIDWLRNMGDWMISKKRYWGLALPIWKCGSCNKFDVIGGKKELMDRATTGWDDFDGHSPHRPWLDTVKITCTECGSIMDRIPDVGNAWLDAGIVSFSTLGYLDNPSLWKQWYPASWISESFPGQFRNWFYSLITMSVALEGLPPADNVFSYALMRDQKGEEMHKSKGNAIWFEDAAEKMGVDVMRWVFARHNPASNLNFGFLSGDEVRRQFIIPLWNIFSFFTTYAEIDGWHPNKSNTSLESIYDYINQKNKKSETFDISLLQENFTELDKWILSETEQLKERVTTYLENWRVEYASQAIEKYVDSLSNWYVRRSRRRFWKSENDNDKQSAYSTLYYCLTNLSRIMAPFAPFFTEHIYQTLVRDLIDDAEDSVHLTDWPTVNEYMLNQDLSRTTQLAIKLASLGRSARAQSNIRVRQPLETLLVEVKDDWEVKALSIIGQQLIEELNVKNVRLAHKDDKLLNYKLKPELRKLGPKYGAQLNQIRQLLNTANPREITRLVESGKDIHLGNFILDPSEIIIEKKPVEGYSIASESDYVVAVDTAISEDLFAEGIAREIVHMVQNLRKSAELEISDRIYLAIKSGPKISEAIKIHRNYIKEETLAKSFRIGIKIPNGVTETKSLHNESLIISLKKS